MTPEQRKRVLQDLLSDMEAYFDERADADQPSGGAAIPNEEMNLLCRIREAQKMLTR